MERLQFLDYGGKTTKKGVLRIMEKKDEWVWFIYRARVFSKWGE
jgi:hypothetical protein